MSGQQSLFFEYMKPPPSPNSVVPSQLTKILETQVRGQSSCQMRLYFFRQICNIDLAAKKHKVLWEDSRLPFDHVPFVVVNHKVYDCQHGVDRHLSEKRKNQAVH